MMQDLSHLLTLQPDSIEFEAERARLIKAEIEAAPEHHRKKMYQLQLELDLLRVHSTPEEFMRQIVLKLQENVENLEDIAQYLKNISIKK